MKIDLVVGARPNFVKAAALFEAAKKHPKIQMRLLHTGQHKGIMSDLYFKELQLPASIQPGVLFAPPENPEARFGHMIQELSRFWKRCADFPDFVMVVGDTDSTAAAAIAAAKSRIPVIHVEAGLRCGDMGMQEEINRILVDSISEIHYTTTEDARNILIAEGHRPWGVKFVGDVMVDTLLRFLPDALARRRKFGLDEEPFGILTLHRAENVDDLRKRHSILAAVDVVAKEIKILFPAHPRTSKPTTFLMTNMKVAPPMGYIDFIGCLASARFVMTDSGGVQEESTALGVPCLTLRENTERPETLKYTNTLIGTDYNEIIQHGRRLAETGRQQKGAVRVPPMWDGHAADRIMEDLSRME